MRSVFFTWTEIVYYEISSCVFLSPILIHSLSLLLRALSSGLWLHSKQRSRHQVYTQRFPSQRFDRQPEVRREARERHLHCMHHPAALYSLVIRTDTHVCAHPLRAKTIIIIWKRPLIPLYRQSAQQHLARFVLGCARARQGGVPGPVFLKRFPPRWVFGRRFRSSSTLGQWN